MSDLLSRLDGSAEVGADGQLLPGAGWVDDPEAKMCRLEDSPMGAEHGDEDRNVVRKLLDKVRSLLGIGSED